MTHALSTLASQFELLKVEVTVQLQKDTQLPEFKGSMLHGWFGHALKAVDEQAFHMLFGSHGQSHPKPYIITPPADHKTQWKAQELFTFEITLFGTAIAVANLLTDVITHGATLGLGGQRCPFTFISLASLTPQGKQSGIVVTTLMQWLSHAPQHLETLDAEIAINLITPVRVKHHGHLITTNVPDLSFWCNHSLRRLISLSRFWVNDAPTLFDDLYHQLPPMHIGDSSSHCFFEDWQRYSLKQQQQLPFGGLKGQISFYGQLGQAPQLLLIASLLHIGGKTTFGLGKIDVIS